MMVADYEDEWTQQSGRDPQFQPQQEGQLHQGQQEYLAENRRLAAGLERQRERETEFYRQMLARQRQQG